MSEIILLPCPFCGGKAEYCKVDWIGKEYWVKCTKCSCKTSMSNNYKKPIEEWNTRKPMQEIVERLEEMKKNNIDWITIESLYYDGKVAGLEDAIEICKEVGGMNE